MDLKALLAEKGPQLAIAALAAKSGGPSAFAAFNEGLQQAALRQQQLARQQQMDAQQNDLHQAQMQNVRTDNARLDQAQRNDELQRALAMVDAATKQQAETATDPAQAENEILKRAVTAAGLYGLPPDQLTGMVPSMAAPISARKKKQAAERYDALKKVYGEDAVANDRITDSGELFNGMKPSQILAMAGLGAQTPTGEAAKPAAATAKPQILDLGGRKVVVDPSQLKPGQVFNDVPAAGASSETGWTIQQVSDPATNSTKLVRVNSRTGAVEPVALPPGVQAGGARQTRLTAGQQEDLATMATVQDMAKQLVELGDRTGWKGVGGFGAGSLRQFGSTNLGTGTDEEVQLRAKIGNIKGTIAKLRGGTSFTPNEQKLLDSYTPGINETDKSIRNKLIGLNEFIETKRKNTMQFAGADTQTTKADPLGIR